MSSLATLSALPSLPVLPVVIPMVAGALLILSHRRQQASRAISLISNLMTLATCFALVSAVRIDGIQVLNLGGWPAPFGIVFAVDMLGALMVTIAMVVSTATLLFSFHAIDEGQERYYFYAFFQFLLMGVNGSFLTGDIFNLFVWFEVLLISSYALMALGGQPYQLAETLKYLVINAAGAILFLFAIGLTYALTGTLNMADLSVKLAEVEHTGLVNVLAALYIAVFSIKAGLFPVYVWLPRAYFSAPTVVSALFGGLLTKVGIYALFRVVTLWFSDVALVQPTLLVLAGATMLFGVLGALSQWDMKRVLSYHIISQVGYMIMGLALCTPLALAGGIFYILHHILVKTALFLIAGAVQASRGTTSLRRLGGIVEGEPILAGLFMLAGLALAGAPPLSGFIAKFMLIDAGLREGQNLLVATSVIVSFLTLFSMMKIFRYAFWRSEQIPATPQPGNWARLGSLGSLLLIGVMLGLGAEAVLPYTHIAAEQLLNPAGYVEAVLRESAR
jgi:multicomponent Na+:H+ antiporter subunit D